jgi:hypothetical protein
MPTVQMDLHVLGGNAEVQVRVIRMNAIIHEQSVRLACVIDVEMA